MGTAQPSKPCSIPTRPFDKHGHRRSCFGAAVFLPRRKNHSSSTLVQLILLQDWQRVLIRANLFPHEVSKPCTIKLYGIYWKLLPLHLACALQPPPKVVSLLLTQGAASRPVERRKKMRLSVPSWNFSSLASPEDRKELLSTRDDYLDDQFSIDTTTTNHSYWIIRKDHYQQPNGSLVSLEQSIGDMTSIATRTIDDGTAIEASLDHFLDQTGVVLQLTANGGIVPMPVLPLSHLQDLTHSTESAPLEIQQESLLQAASETKTLLPIHIACLYQASPSVLQVLLQEYPMGVLSAVMGMLPIHLVAAGWTTEPLESSCLSTSIPSAMKVDDGNHSRTQALRVLIQALPESVTAKSAYHGMTPKEYVEENTEGLEKEECLEILVTQALQDLREKERGPTSE
jgi:hypothetical protein